MIPRMKGSFFILSYFVRANFVNSFSSPFPELFDAAASGEGNLKARDNEIMSQSNGVEDYLAKSILSSKGPPTSLDTQLPQAQSDAHPIPFEIDQPSTSDDQSNPLEPSDSKNLALEPGDMPIPLNLPSIGSGEMDYGPNILQQIQQLWQHPFDVHKQPEPECKPRKIPWGEDKLLKMFAMCCGKAPGNRGPGSSNRLRASWRRTNCYLCKYWIKALLSNLFSIVLDHHSWWRTFY